MRKRAWGAFSSSGSRPSDRLASLGAQDRFAILSNGGFFPAALAITQTAPRGRLCDGGQGDRLEFTIILRFQVLI